MRHGIDIVEILEIRKLVDGPKRKFINRVFTQSEIEYCENKINKYQHYAARFAAKEACIKLLQLGLGERVFWKEMEVVNDSSGCPRLVLNGSCEILFRKLNLCDMCISISHCTNYAIASIVAN